MENEKLKGADLVPTTETTAELIPDLTAKLVEKSLVRNTP